MLLRYIQILKIVINTIYNLLYITTCIQADIKLKTLHCIAHLYISSLI